MCSCDRPQDSRRRVTERLQITCSVSRSWCIYSTSRASALRTAGPCRCHSAHPEAQIANIQTVRELLFLLCVYSSRSEDVFLHSGCLAPRREVPQMSEVWPYPSCNWRKRFGFKTLHFFFFLNLFPVVSELSFSYLSQLSSLSHPSCSFCLLPYSLHHSTSPPYLFTCTFDIFMLYIKYYKTDKSNQAI